ncbi:MAG: Bug family tripartite tricarboxylate transporter substrate binding protein [Beijerinckiaceae bacterium]
MTLRKETYGRGGSITRRLLLAAACLAGFGAAPMGAAAQQWPSRAVTIVVPFPAGGNTDTMARLAADYMSRTLGQNFIVENRPTAGGVVASAQIARSEPDGTTLFFASAGQLIILPLMQKVNYDPDKDFIPVSIFGTGPFVLGVRSNLPVKTMPELIAYAKGHKDKLNVASAGQGSIGHLSAALFGKRAGLEFVFVPYKGGGPAMQALLNHETDIYFGNASELLQHVDGGRIRVLGVSSEKPLAQIPNVPPVATLFPGFKTSSWNGFFVPAGTPPAIVSRLEQSVAAAVKDPTIRSRLEALGIEPIGNSSKEFAAIINADKPLYREAVEAAGLLAK